MSSITRQSIHELRLAAAVEEERHVGVLFGFGDAQLAFSGFGNGFTEGVLHQLLVEEDVDAGEGGVVWGQAAVVERQGVHSDVPRTGTPRGRKPSVCCSPSKRKREAA